MNLRKVNRHVDFPLILDLAPFCSASCKVCNYYCDEKILSKLKYSLCVKYLIEGFFKLFHTSVYFHLHTAFTFLHSCIFTDLPLLSVRTLQLVSASSTAFMELWNIAAQCAGATTLHMSRCGLPRGGQISTTRICQVIVLLSSAS